MTSITRIALRHRKLVVLVWVLLAVAGAATISSTTSGLTHSLATPGTPGSDTNQAIQRRFGISGAEQPTIAVLRLPPGESMRTPPGRAAAARTFAAINRAGHVAVADYANTRNPKLVSADGRTTWALVDMPNPDVPLGSGVIDRIPTVLRAAAPKGAVVSVTGFEQLQSAGAPGGGGPSTFVETLIGMAGALVVLTVVFGSALAVLPLLMAVPAILTSFLLILGLEQFGSMSFLLEYLVALIGLGVAIDYSLLVVTRWREERERGAGPEAAVLAAGATAGHAVVISGLTVAIGLFSLIVLPVPFLRSVGVGGMLIPLVALLAAITLLPVTLAAWGPALDRRRLRSGATASRTWARWGATIVRRRWIASVAGLVIVGALALPALSMNNGQPDTSAFPSHTPAARTLAGLRSSGVPDAVVFPVQVLTHGGAAGVARIAQIADATPGVYTTLAPDTPSFRAGQTAFVSIIPRQQGSTSVGRNLIVTLRERLTGVPGGAHVGGNTAVNRDFVAAVYGNFPLMLGLIALITFVLVARSFRSVLLAAKAVVLNVISLGASYGFLVLFWQQGHGSSAIYGVPATGAIQDFIPILTFAFLFGLSMDYEVFVLARMREEYDRTGSTPEAVVGALSHTGRLVTSASLILAISFLSLSTNPDLPVRIIATGLSFGILFDAFVVRTLLVPALVALMGRWNWWMPSGLARTLRVRDPRPAPANPTRLASQAADGA